MRQVLVYPNKTLRKKLLPVAGLTDDLLKEISEAKEVLYHIPNAAAIAANQLGFESRFFIFKNDSKTATTVINPELDLDLLRTPMKEGCLSFPGFERFVDRSRSVKVRYKNESWETVNEEYSGFVAQVFQHETDHLNGVLFVDDLPKDVRQKIAMKIVKR